MDDVQACSLLSYHDTGEPPPASRVTVEIELCGLNTAGAMHNTVSLFDGSLPQRVHDVMLL